MTERGVFVSFPGKNLHPMFPVQVKFYGVLIIVVFFAQLFVKGILFYYRRL